MTQQQLQPRKIIEVKQLVLMALMASFAIVAMLFLGIPWSFLTYDPKDVFIIFTSFWFGPIWAIITSCVVQGIEMLLISSNGPIGFLMGATASISYCVPAGMIYRRHRTKGGAITGLAVGSVVMIVAMILLNLYVTPKYYGISQQEVIEMIAPLLLPFNLVKTAINTTIIIVLYKPLSNVLRHAHLLPVEEKAR